MTTVNKIGERIADLFGESSTRSIISITFLWFEIPAVWFFHSPLNSRPFTCLHLLPSLSSSNTSFSYTLFLMLLLSAVSQHQWVLEGFTPGFIFSEVAGNGWWGNHWQVNRYFHFFWLYAFSGCFLLNLWLSKSLFWSREYAIRSILTDFLVLSLSLTL